MSLNLHRLPAFNDNYLWLVANNGKAWAIDPGDASVIKTALHQQGLSLAGILLTHHHADHTGGVTELVSAYGVPVLGPAECGALASRIVGDGDQPVLEVLGNIRVLGVPGHTLGHLAFYLPEAGLLFCGDTLFSAGCGRLFEGTPAMMHNSLQKLASLPDDTLVCCAHEYTLANLRFALAADGENPDVAARLREVEQLRARMQPTVPARLGDEKRWNPFLRCDAPDVTARAALWRGASVAAGEETFAALRAWKDNFR